MDSVNPGSGGGIHPGAPIIWPTIKPTPQSPESVSDSQSQSQSRTSSSAASSASTAASQALSQASSAAAASASAQVSRALSKQDISTQLMSINMADTPENQAMASKMLEYGLELSPENFSQLYQALQTKSSNPTSQTAAFTALAKGVAANPAAMRALEQTFSGANNLSAQLQQLQQGMAQTQAALNGQSSLNPALANRVSTMLGGFDTRIKKMQNQEVTPRVALPSTAEASLLQNAMNAKFAQMTPGQQAAMTHILSGQSTLSEADMAHLQSFLNGGVLSEAEMTALNQIVARGQLPQMAESRLLLQDLTAFKSLIAGIRQQIEKTGNPEEKQRLIATLKALESQMSDVIDNVVGQSILSKLSKNYDPKLPDKYFYWMIPNPFSERSKNIEILVKRDPTKKKAPVNPDKTQIILKVETESMGDIAVIVEITGKDVWYLFNTPNEDARRYIAANSAMLRSQMSNLEFQVKGFQSQVKKIEINKILSPTLDLDHMKRVRTEV